MIFSDVRIKIVRLIRNMASTSPLDIFREALEAINSAKGSNESKISTAYEKSHDAISNAGSLINSERSKSYSPNMAHTAISVTVRAMLSKINRDNNALKYLLDNHSSSDKLNEILDSLSEKWTRVIETQKDMKNRKSGMASGGSRKRRTHRKRRVHRKRTHHKRRTYRN